MNVETVSTLYRSLFLINRVSQFHDVDLIAKEIDCLPNYVAKGIAMGCFYYGRCLEEGHGVKRDKEEAKKCYSKVGIITYLFLHWVDSSFHCIGSTYVICGGKNVEVNQFKNIIICDLSLQIDCDLWNFPIIELYKSRYCLILSGIDNKPTMYILIWFSELWIWSWCLCSSAR